MSDKEDQREYTAGEVQATIAEVSMQYVDQISALQQQRNEALDKSAAISMEFGKFKREAERKTVSLENLIASKDKENAALREALSRLESPDEEKGPLEGDSLIEEEHY